MIKQICTFYQDSFDIKEYFEYKNDTLEIYERYNNNGELIEMHDNGRNIILNTKTYNNTLFKISKQNDNIFIRGYKFGMLIFHIHVEFNDINKRIIRFSETTPIIHRTYKGRPYVIKKEFHSYKTIYDVNKSTYKQLLQEYNIIPNN